LEPLVLGGEGAQLAVESGGALGAEGKLIGQRPLLGAEIGFPATLASQTLIEAGQGALVRGELRFQFPDRAGVLVERLLLPGQFSLKLFERGDARVQLLVEGGEFAGGRFNARGEGGQAAVGVGLLAPEIGEPALDPSLLGDPLLAGGQQPRLFRFEGATLGGEGGHALAGGQALGHGSIAGLLVPAAFLRHLAQLAFAGEHAAFLDGCAASDGAARPGDLTGAGDHAPADRQGTQCGAGGGKIVDHQCPPEQRPDNRFQLGPMADQTGGDTVDARHPGDLGRKSAITAAAHRIERLERGASGAGPFQKGDGRFGVSPALDHNVLEVTAERDFHGGFELGRRIDQLDDRTTDATELILLRGLLDGADALIETGAAIVQALEGLQTGGDTAEIALGAVNLLASGAFGLGGVFLARRVGFQ
jgi:hypothetical protein